MSKSDKDVEFTSFVERSSQGLLRYCYLLTGQDASAQDLLQASLVKVYESWNKIRDLRAVDGYTKTVITRTHVSTARRGGSREVVTGQVPDQIHSDGGDLDLQDAMWRLLAQLGPRQRAALVLRFYDDLPLADVATILGCSVGTVKSQISRGLTRLRVLLPDADLLIEGRSS